jgi:hypothetical protein
VAEVAWLCMQQARLQRLNAERHDDPGGDPLERLRQFLTLKGVIDFREFLEGWFMNAPMQDILRENLLDFVAYGFWCALPPRCTTFSPTARIKTVTRMCTSTATLRMSCRATLCAHTRRSVPGGTASCWADASEALLCAGTENDPRCPKRSGHRSRQAWLR